MKKVKLLIMPLVVTVSLVGCSGGAPSTSVVEEKALAAFKNQLPGNVEVKVAKSQCEPTSQEKQYDCYVLFNINGKNSDARKYTFSQANNQWFITSGGYGFPRNKREQLGFVIER